MKKIMKKSLVIVLAVMMTFVFSVSTSFAEAVKPKLNYVALGDSMSQGYMFTDYNEDASQGHQNGWEGSSERSSIKMFKKYLEIKYGEDNVKLTDLSIQGFQPDELWALFRQHDDNGYDISTDSTLTNGADMHFDWWVGEYGIFATHDEMADIYYEAIKNADILTYDIGENYFGTYRGDRTGVAGVNEKGEHFTELLEFLTKEEQEQVEELRKKLMDKIDPNQSGLAETVDGLLYAYVSYIYYTDKCIDKIYGVCESFSVN